MEISKIGGRYVLISYPNFSKYFIIHANAINSALGINYPKL